MSGNPELRRELDAASKIRFASEYRSQLARLQQQFDHTVTILPDGLGRIERFNCFAYALGVWNHDAYVKCVDRDSNSAVLDSNMVQQMIGAGEFVDLAPSAAKAGDIALYFDGDRLTHAGVIASDAGQIVVNSKWGGNEVHRHGLWEVPAMYGNRVQFVAPPALDAILKRLGQGGIASDA